MRFDGVGLAELYVDPAAIGKSPCFAGSEVLVCVGNTLVKLFLKLVFFRVWIGIAEAPNFLDEFVALVVCFQFLPGVTLGLSKNQIVVFDPLDVGLLSSRLTLRGFSSGSRLGSCAGIERVENEMSRRKVSVRRSMRVSFECGGPSRRTSNRTTNGETTGKLLRNSERLRWR
jgi:hypothetical protein